MNLFGKMSRVNKVFLFILPLAFLGAVGILFLSTQSTNQTLTGASNGCELPPAAATGQYLEVAKRPFFNNQPVNYQLAELTPDPEALKEEGGAILGATSDERWIEVDLSEQKLRAHEGDKIAYEFLISSGKWAPTPVGEYRIWIKLRYTKMSGGSKANNTYYYLPNVPYTQYFYKGYGLHGTYWHQNFGQPMSHGCVNLSIPNAEKLFYWTAPVMPRGKGIVYPTKTNPGTRVVVHE